MDGFWAKNGLNGTPIAWSPDVGLHEATMKKLGSTTAVIVALFGLVATATTQSHPGGAGGETAYSASQESRSPEPAALGAIVAGAAALRQQMRRRR